MAFWISFNAFAFASSDSSELRKPQNCQITDQPALVQGESMSELYRSGQSIRVAMGYHSCHPVTRGEVVLFKHYSEPHPVVKLVQGVPGDRFYLRGFGKGFHLVLNNEVLKTPKGRPYLFPPEAERILRHFEVESRGVIPENHYLIFGTNPGGSVDSSRFGPVLKQELLGRVD
jgi:signal peptidase I